MSVLTQGRGLCIVALMTKPDQLLCGRYADSIVKLTADFTARKKKGKLPNEATCALKSWWDANLVWPYPSEDNKKSLEEATGLTATQINNWFINQRKRHWHKVIQQYCCWKCMFQFCASGYYCSPYSYSRHCVPYSFSRMDDSLRLRKSPVMFFRCMVSTFDHL